MSMAHVDELWLKHIGRRWGHQRLRLDRDRRHALAPFFDELETDLTDTWRCFVRAHSAGRAVACKRCTPGFIDEVL
jgi:hypothetical protein